MDPPTIMAVNGTAAGAGMSLSLTGDIVLMAESAKMTMAYTAAALSPDGSSSYFLPRLVGVRRAAELMITIADLRRPRRWSGVSRPAWFLTVNSCLKPRCRAAASSWPDACLRCGEEDVSRNFYHGPGSADGDGGAPDRFHDAHGRWQRRHRSIPRQTQT